MYGKNNYIAVDLGAGSGRVFLGTLCDCKIETREIHRFSHDIVHEDGFLKWDWPRIKREVFRGLEKTFAELNGEKLSSISCDSWAQDFGLLDKNGTLIFSPVSYRDTRTNGVPDKIKKIVTPESLLKRNGAALSPITSLCQLKAMSVKNPEILENASSLLHIADLLNFELCGVAASNWTSATVSQLWNIQNRRCQRRGFAGDSCYFNGRTRYRDSLGSSLPAGKRNFVPEPRIMGDAGLFNGE